MRCYTEEQCAQWLASRNRSKPGEDKSLVKISAKVHDFRTFPLAHWMATSLTFRGSTLLWITEWSIWPSSENWHLYYTLRQLSGDRRLLHEAPGHLFLTHETDELATVLQAALLNGWGGFFLTEADYVNAFFSHDEYIDFYASDDAKLTAVREWLKP